MFKASQSQAQGVYVDTDDLIALKQLGKELDLNSSKPSHSILSGASRTRYRGRGMEFAEVRPYQAGDDIRTIDWRVTARTQSPYTKLFQEERERPVFVVLDQRSPMFFGSRLQMKSVHAAKIAASIGWAAQANNDRIGALILGDREQADIRPKGGKKGILELLNRIVAFNQQINSPVADHESLTIQDMMTEARRIARPGSLITIISDFHDLNEDAFEALGMLTRHSDVYAFHVYDPIEQLLPGKGSLTVANNHSRMSININAVKDDFQQQFEQRQKLLLRQCNTTGVTLIDACNKHPATDLLPEIFGKNKKLSRSRLVMNRGTR